MVEDVDVDSECIGPDVAMGIGIPFAAKAGSAEDNDNLLETNGTAMSCSRR